MSTTAGDEISVSIGSGVKTVFVTLVSNPDNDTENWATEVEVSYPGITLTVNPNKKRNNFGHYTVVINTHAYTAGGTLKVKNISGGKLIVDYFGDMKLPQSCYPALVYDTSYCSDWFYVNGNSSFADGVNDAWIDENNEGVRAMVADEFAIMGYPVATVRTNKYFNPETMTPSPNTADGIHPDDDGHFAIHKSTTESIILIPTI
jgi:hypothetical protein